MLVGTRKGFHHHLARPRHARETGLQRQPFAHLIGQARPRVLIGQQSAHARGEIGRERKLAARVGRHLGVGIVGARDIDLILDQRLVAHDLAAEHEGVAGHQSLDEILLDLAEQPPAARDGAGRTAATNFATLARAHQPHLQHRFLDDGADIEPITLPHLRIGDAPAAFFVLPDTCEPLVAFQRVAAGGDERDHVVETGARQVRVRRRAAHFRVEIIGEKRRAAGAAEHMLRQHVERAQAQRRGILRVLVDRVDGDAAFQHLETVGRHQHRTRGFVEAVIGAADPLHQPRRPLRRADIDDEVDITPVDPEIERRRTDHAAQAALRHRLLDLAALRDIERAVMQCDGEAVVVDAPQILEQHLGLAAGVDEHQRGPIAPDEIVDLAERVARRMPRPWQPLARIEHFDDGRGGTAGDHDIGGRAAVAFGCRGRRQLRHQKTRQ